MKIVNTIKTILLLSVVVILPSCLDLDPQDQMSDANLWQTPNDYKLYANQFYEWTRDFSSAVYDGPHSDTRSDLMTSSSYNEYSKGIYNPQIQISAESETKRSIFREKDKTKRSKKESAQHSKSRNKSFVMTSVSAL